jgi:uncharacterized RDD family membrane protein YckC
MAKTVMSNQDIFAGDYNIDTPESVAFDYTIADVGNRSVAAFVDIVVVGIALAGLNGLLWALLAAWGVDVGLFGLDESEIGWGAGLAIAVYAILNFLVFWGYFMLFELKWNGQTIGKQMVKIRVVRVDGSPAGATEVAVRNLVRIIDFLPSIYLVGLITMLSNRQARRLGDLAGGTLVVKADLPVKLDDLVRSSLAAATPTREAASAPRTQPVASGAEATGADAGRGEPEQAPPSAALDVRGLRPADYALIVDVLGRDARSPLQDDLLDRLAAAIAIKIGYTAEIGRDPRRFLRQVADAYRRKG